MSKQEFIELRAEIKCSDMPQQTKEKLIDILSKCFGASEMEKAEVKND